MSLPFKGQFKMAAPTGGTASVGAEAGTDYSAYYVTAAFTPEFNLINCGPYLKDNFASQQPGSASVPMTVTLEGLTQALILTLAAAALAKTKYELVYMALASPALGSPSAANMEVTVQFYFDKVPMIPSTVDEKEQFIFGANATYWLMTDGSSPVDVGTLEPA